MQPLQPCCAPVLRAAEHKGQLRQRAKAIFVPAEEQRSSAAQCLFAHLRHSTCAGGDWRPHHCEAAWQSCQRLHLVKLQETVVCLQD